ncbi:MAG: hypothetical protein AB1815_05875 [Bacillota bacterium]
MDIANIGTFAAVGLAVFVVAKFVSKQVIRVLVAIGLILLVLGALANPGDVMAWVENTVSRAWPIILSNIHRGTDAALDLLSLLSGGGGQ